MLTKKELRKKILAERKAMDDETVALNSQVICRKILEMTEYEEADDICLYMPINNEVDVMLLADIALEDGKTVWIPKVVSKTENGNAGKMVFNKYEGSDNSEIGAYNIIESTSEEMLKPSDTTLIIMPGSVFTPWRDRIGYGGGYYDRFLEENNACNTIAVCYELQIVNEILAEEFDKKPDYIITETSIYR